MICYLFISDNVTKKGWLTYQENALEDTWVERWFILRRPYIYIYTNDKETEEQGIINVSTVRIDYNPALESMIKVIVFNNNLFTHTCDSANMYFQFIQITTHICCKQIPNLT